MRVLERSAALVGVLALSLAICPAAGLTGCASRPSGPVWEPLAPPDADSTLLYLYRFDALRGVGGARVKLDGEKLATLANRQYVALVLEPGEHRLGASLLWLGFLARSWTDAKLRVKGSETVYVRIRAATDALPDVPEDAEIPGRSDERAAVGLFIERVDPAEARLELRTTRRAELD